MQAVSGIDAGVVLEGRYRIEGAIGAGAFGAVYRATQLAVARPVAIKVLHAGVLASPQTLSRFRREAEMAQSLSHPNTVRLFDFGQMENGALYIVWELLEGKPLDTLIAESGALSVARVVRIGSQVLKALMEAHSRGIVHRDIKPSNIFICDFPGEPDFVKVLDFGIAKTSVEGSGSMTADGQMIGTPSYMAPEQVRGADVGPTTDLYALGLVLAEALTGRVVVQGRSVMDVCMAQASTAPVPLPPEVLKSPLGPILQRATEKDATRRTPSAERMLGELSAAGLGDRVSTSGTLVMAHSTSGAAPPTTFGGAAHPGSVSGAAGAYAVSARTVDPRAPRPRTGGRALVFAVLGALLLGAVVAAGGGAWLLGRRSAARAERQAARANAGAPRAPTGVIDLAERDPTARGTGYPGLDVGRVRRGILAAGFEVEGKPIMNIEGGYTAQLINVSGKGKTGAVTFYRFDDETEAKHMQLVASARPDTAVRRELAALIEVRLEGDAKGAATLLEEIVRQQKR